MNISEAIVWAYRLYLDREPENKQVIEEKLNRLTSIKDVSDEFINSVEFKNKHLDLFSTSVSLLGDEEPMTIETATDDIEDLFAHIQNVWENLGKVEPHWSVLTNDKFKLSNIQNTKLEFYQTGQEDVRKLFKILERNSIDYSHFKACLEYGCGLGRVTCSLAKRLEQVIGYDISNSHLKLAQEFIDEQKIENITLKHIKSPRAICDFPKVDIVYSIIVLQHNPPPIIKTLILEFLKCLNSGGVAFFQVPTYKIGYKFSVQEYLTNVVNKEDRMEMHVIPQSDIYDMVLKEGCRLIEVIEDGLIGLIPGFRSNTFVIQKR